MKNIRYYQQVELMQKCIMWCIIMYQYVLCWLVGLHAWHSQKIYP